MYGAISSCLVTANDYELIAFELAEELADQDCRYAEVAFTPGFHARSGVAHATYVEGLSRARQRARRELGVELAWIFDFSRAWRGGESETHRWADYAVCVAIEARSEGVVALGLGGPEAGHPPEPFAPYFERARAAGLHAYPHAGEHGGPTSVRGAVEALGAERIAHGVRAIEDPALVAAIAARGIALDVCPTSDLRLGVYPDLAEHPLPRFAFRERLARLRALLSQHATQPKDSVPGAADVELDPANRSARRAGAPVDLTGKEFAALELLLRNPDRVLSRTQIVRRATHLPAI